MSHPLVLWKLDVIFRQAYRELFRPVAGMLEHVLLVPPVCSS